MLNEKFHLSNIKKFLLKKGYTVYRKKTKPINRDFKNLIYVTLSSFFLIFIFSLLPKKVKFASNILIKPEIVENNSIRCAGEPYFRHGKPQKRYESNSYLFWSLFVTN